MSDVSPPPVEWKYDYVQTAKPADAEEGESWYDLDDDRALVFTDNSGGTRELTVTEHAQLAGITRDAHHNPVSVDGPLRLSSGQVLDLAAADGLTLDADGRLRVAAGSVSEAMLGFDAATQTDLNSHAGDAGAHHSKPTKTGEPPTNQSGGTEQLGSLSGGATGILWSGGLMVSSLSISASTGSGYQLEADISYTWYDYEQSTEKSNTVTLTGGYSTTKTHNPGWGKHVELRQVEVTSAKPQTSTDATAEKPAVVPHIHEV